MLKLVQQRGEKTCGQAVVAMLGNISYEEAVTLIGHEGRTFTGQLYFAFQCLGFDCPDRLVRKGKKTELPARCAAKLSCKGDRHWGNWVAYFEGTVYDPWYGVNPVYPKRVRVTSFLPLQLRSR